MHCRGLSLKIRPSLSLVRVMSIRHFQRNILHLGLPLLCQSFLNTMSGMELVKVDEEVVFLSCS